MGYLDNNRINSLIKSELDYSLKEYGNTKYAYAIMNKKKPTEMTIINNNPKWFTLYLENAYQLTDPVIIKSLDRVEDFQWGDEQEITPPQSTVPKIFIEAKKHNINAGHTFILHDNNDNLAVLSIYEETLKTSYFNLTYFVEKNRNKFQQLLIKTHQEMLNSYKKINMINSNSSALTKRENEVIYWASSGKTYREISIILGIKLCTVNYHMTNIIKKLGVSNAKHAIKRAVELKIIQLPYE